MEKTPTQETALVLMENPTYEEVRDNATHWAPEGSDEVKPIKSKGPIRIELDPKYVECVVTPALFPLLRVDWYRRVPKVDFINGRAYAVLPEWATSDSIVTVEERCTN